MFRAGQDGKRFFSLRLGHWHAPASGTAWFDDVRLEELPDWAGAYEKIAPATPDPGIVTGPLRLSLFTLFVPFVVFGLVWLRRLPAVATRPPPPLSLHGAFGLGLLLVAGMLARLLLALAPVPQGAPSPLETWALFLAGPADPGHALRPQGLDPPAPAWTHWLSLVGGLAKAGLWENTPGFRLLLHTPALVAEMTALGFVLAYLRPRASAGFWPICSLLLVLGPALPYASALLGLPQTVGGATLVLAIMQLQRGRHLLAGGLVGFSVAAAPSLTWLLVPLGAWLGTTRGWQQAAITLFVGAACAGVIAAPVADLYAPRPDLPALLAMPVAGSLWSGTHFPNLLLVLVPLTLSLGMAWSATGKPGTGVPGGGLPVRVAWLSALMLMAIWFGPDPALLYLAVFLGMLNLDKGHPWGWLWFALAVTSSAHWGFEYYREHLDPAPYGPGAAVALVQLVILGIGLAAWRTVLQDDRSLRGRENAAGGRRSTDEALSPPTAWPVSPFRPRGRDLVTLTLIFGAGLYLVGHDMGEHRYPQNPHQVGEAGETHHVSFDPPVRLERVRLYTGANGFGTARFEAEGPEGRTALWPGENGVIRYTGKQQRRRSTFKVLEREVALGEPVSTLRVMLEGQGFDVGEIVFFDREGRAVTPATVKADRGAAMPAGAHPLFDEPGQVTAGSSYRAETYWDEVYYARTAYELAQGLPPYERTHPPLGKILLSLGVRTLDMTPSGWRFADLLVIAVFPLLLWSAARWLYGTRTAAYAAAFLGFFELMFFVHGRWANIDAFLTLFLFCSLVALLRWYQLGDGNFNRRNAGWFIGAALCFGLALATKWSALFTGFAIFLLWVIHQVSRATALSTNPAARSHFYRVRLPADLLAWGAGFILLPAVVYYLSYIPVLTTLPGSPEPFTAAGWRAFLDLQAFQWSYHADREVSHKSSSLFFTWPLMWQPVSLVKIDGMPDGVRATIQIMGNPVIWWTGFAAMLALGWRAALGRDRVALLLAGIYFLQCLPWLLVTRTTYLYHYLPCLPILILGIVYWISGVDFQRRTSRAAAVVFTLAVLTGFALYYPYVTATPVPVGWTDKLRVFETWARL